jgi:ankyrin repeat protein
VKPKKLAEQCTMCLRTQFHWGHSKGAAWLLAHGADPNSLYPNSGNSALHAAAKNGASEAVIALLLKHGGDRMVKNKDGKTAIELARTAGKSRVVKQLQKR